MSGQCVGGDATGDVISGFENLTGSGFNDFLTGDAGSNTLDGGEGSDFLEGGAGSDALNGGAGTDAVVYRNSAQGVSVNLQSGMGQFGDAEGDTFIGIETVIGSQYLDVVNGSDSAEVILGGDGQDFLFGHGGDDFLYGQEGNDLLLGAAGNDTLVGGAGNDTFWAGVSQGDYNAGMSTFVGSDTLTGGSGSDYFIFHNFDGINTITDFEVGTDFLMGYQRENFSFRTVLDDGNGGSSITWSLASFEVQVFLENVSPSEITNDIFITL